MCSDAERVNFSLVADLKDPLIAKVSYHLLVFFCASVKMQLYVTLVEQLTN